MKKNYIIGLKKIKGDMNNSGIYAITNDSVIRLIDSNNNVVSNLKIEEKIRLFNNHLQTLLHFQIYLNFYHKYNQYHH